MIYNTLGFPLLTFVVFLPLAAAVIAFFIRENEPLVRRLALTVMGVDFALSLVMLANFNPSTYQMQFVERVPWIPTFNINYTLGVDGISLLMILLTTLLTPIAVIATWNSVRSYVREYMIALLILESAVLGVFMALDLVLFYVFWEAMLIPMYLLIGIWGGPRRLYATLKFFIYTLAGSVLMLVGIIALYYAGGKTFDLLTLTAGDFSARFQFWVFLAFFLAFAVKAPMFPFHTWLPDAYVQAPTAVTVLLAAVLSKMGIYGFLRFCLPLFPDASIALAPLILWLSLITILYGAFVTIAQTDYKRLIAYSSFSHMGFMTLGVFAFNLQGVGGAVLQMFNHGIVVAALFIMAGLLYERCQSYEISALGGIAKWVPIFATLLMFMIMANLGLPGLSVFVGEFLILLGAFIQSKLIGSLATLSIIFVVVYMLYMYHGLLYGKVTRPESETIRDLNFREGMALVPLLILVVWIGVYPESLLGILRVSVDHLVQQVTTDQTAPMAGLKAFLRQVFST
jgi:NADH-quinone oxidoreductase subunit M